MKSHAQYQYETYYKLKQDPHARAMIKMARQDKIYSIDDPELHEYYEKTLQYSTDLEFESYMIWYMLSNSFYNSYRGIVHQEPCKATDYVIAASFTIIGISLLFGKTLRGG